MQLDNTTVAIRERNLFEILDVAFRLVLTSWKPLLLTWFVGVVPFATINLVMLNGLSDQLAYSDGWFPFVLWSLVWIGITTPIATAPMTLALGSILFQADVQYRRLARSYIRSLPQLLLMQGLLRLICVFPAFLTFIIPYVSWPYLTEVILLERNPLTAKGKALSTWQRNRAIHHAATGELLARWIGVSAAAVILFLSLAGSLYVLVTQFETPDEPFEPVVMLAVATATAWVVVGFTAVVRFLSYIDFRIRREGWEVELTMRAEGIRMQEEWQYA